LHHALVEAGLSRENSQDKHAIEEVLGRDNERYVNDAQTKNRKTLKQMVDLHKSKDKRKSEKRSKGKGNKRLDPDSTYLS
jgi:hypothetical protein